MLTVQTIRCVSPNQTPLSYTHSRYRYCLLQGPHWLLPQAFAYSTSRNLPARILCNWTRIIPRGLYWQRYGCNRITSCPLSVVDWFTYRRTCWSNSSLAAVKSTFTLFFMNQAFFKTLKGICSGQRNKIWQYALQLSKISQIIHVVIHK
jgi:hypothetical protein